MPARAKALGKGWSLYNLELPHGYTASRSAIVLNFLIPLVLELLDARKHVANLNQTRYKDDFDWQIKLSITNCSHGNLDSIERRALSIKGLVTGVDAVESLNIV